MNAPDALLSLLSYPVTSGVSVDSYAMDMPIDAYHSVLTHISHTGMRELLRSPAHFAAYLSGKNSRKAVAPNFGSAVHCAVLEPDKFQDRYIVFEGRRQGKSYDEFKAANVGKEILNADEFERINGIVAALESFKDFPIMKAIRFSEVEKSVFWKCSETGVKCRIRCDALNPFAIFDLKSIDDARPDTVLRQVMRMDYDLQAYMYTAGVKAFTGEVRPFSFIFVEEQNPHGVWMYTAGSSLLASGREKFLRGARAFLGFGNADLSQCYRPAVSIIEAPKWRKQEIAQSGSGGITDSSEIDCRFL